MYLFATNMPLPGATNASLTFTNVQMTNAGTYTVVASNSLGSVTSTVAVLTVNLAPPSTLIRYDPIPYAARHKSRRARQLVFPRRRQDTTFKTDAAISM